jgi:hypothetical protein
VLFKVYGKDAASKYQLPELMTADVMNFLQSKALPEVGRHPITPVFLPPEFDTLTRTPNPL